jgi:hypothetical protein
MLARKLLTCLAVVAVGLLLAGPPAAVLADDHASPAALTARLRAAIKAYEALLKELDLNRLPGQMEGYPQVTEGLEQLGGRLEPLSRVGVQAGEMSAEQWQAFGAAVAAWEADFKTLRQQALPLRLWVRLTAQGIKRPGWGLAYAPTLRVLPREKRLLEAEVGKALELSGAPGETVAGQLVVVPLTQDLIGLRAAAGNLSGPGGLLPAAQIRVLDTIALPLPESETWDVAALPANLQPPPPPLNLARDEVGAYLVVITLPANLKPGLYQGALVVTPANGGRLALTLKVTVTPPTTDAPN